MLVPHSRNEIMMSSKRIEPMVIERIDDSMKRLDLSDLRECDILVADSSSFLGMFSESVVVGVVMSFFGRMYLIENSIKDETSLLNNNRRTLVASDLKASIKYFVDVAVFRLRKLTHGKIQRMKDFFKTNKNNRPIKRFCLFSDNEDVFYRMFDKVGLIENERTCCVSKAPDLTSVIDCTQIGKVKLDKSNS